MSDADIYASNIRLIMRSNVTPVLKKNLGKLLRYTPQAYLPHIDNSAAERFLADHGVRL